MNTYFLAVEESKDNGWTMSHFGNSQIDGKDYTLTTSGLKADQLPNAMTDAKTSAELIAGLLNAFYSGVDVSKLEDEQVIKLGAYKEQVPSPLNSVLPFAEVDLEKHLPF